MNFRETIRWAAGRRGLRFARAWLWVLMGTGLGLALLAGGAVRAADLPPEGRKLFTNSLAPMPAAVSATLQELAAGDLNQPMDLEIALQMRDLPRLRQRIGRREIIPRAELEEKYLPVAADYEKLAKWLKDQGLTITRSDSSRLAVFFRGTVAQIQQVLQVPMARVTVDGQSYHVAKSHPSLPAAIAAPVLGINGLQPYLKLHRHSVAAPAISDAPPYLVSEILGAYDAANLGVTGAGEMIAIVIDTLPLDSDLTTFWTNNNIPQVLSNIETVNVPKATLPATSGEETLDVEWSSSIAPGAQVRVYAAGSLDFTALDVALQELLNDLPTQPSLHQVSISLGLGETYLASGSEMQTDSQYFAAIASGGVTVFVSSGDDGSNPTKTGGTNGPLQVEYYASDPSVTGVGGTSLTLTGTGAESSETAWSGSGGGTSQTFSRPSWQTGAGVPAGSFRLVPDVSLVADPNTGAYFVFNGVIEEVGGTSWSTPTWAGFCALINEARANAAKSPLGLLNPSIYPLIGTANFRDITSGSNGAYTAAAGYDEVTGIGVPDVGVLLATLSAQGPSLTGFNPSSGPPGTAVTLTGANFIQVSDVQFNGASAPFTVNSSTQIAASVPNAASTGPISVVTAGGTVASTTAFTVVPVVVPNDDFANAQVITGPSGTVSGNNAGATKEAGEPNHAGNAGGASVWYAWTAPSPGIYTFDTFGSSFDTLLAVYTGTSVNNLAAVAANDDAAGGVTSAVSFVATAGVTYDIAVDGHDDAIGSIVLNWTLDGSAPEITSFIPATGDPGTVVALNGANFTGATAVLINGTSAAFTVNSPTTLTVTVPAGASTGALSVTTPTGVATSTTVFTVSAVPPNDDFANATVFPGNFGTVAGSNVGATKEPGEPDHAGNAGGKSVWWQWTPSVTGQYAISTAGSSFDTLLAVYTGTSVSALTAVASDAGGEASALTLNAVSGTVYSIAVDGNNGASGNIILSINPLNATATLFATGFETTQGYPTRGTLAGENGWLEAGSGGNGFGKNIFPGQGQQAFIGKTAPVKPNTSLFVWQPLNYTPAAHDIANFSVQTTIIDSNNGNYDLFHWAAYNLAGQQLFAFEFNNATNVISYILDDGAGPQATSASLVNSHIYSLQFTIDFTDNVWSASLDGTTVVTNEPVTTVGSALNLDSIRAAWLLLGTTAGTNEMVFDNYSVTKTSLVAPQFGLQPQDQTVTVGDALVFSAAAYGSPAITYQWYLGNELIPGATSAAYAISSAQGSDAGSYTVTATNAAGLATSSPAVLSVLALETITTAALPAFEGTTSGDGAYASGTNVTVTASPASGYAFANWTENGTIASISDSYSFIATADQSLVANFLPANYSNWSSLHFGAPQLQDLTVSGPLANPAGDGISNLLKYALNLDPDLVETSNLPAVVVQHGFLTLTYRKNKAAADLSFFPEVSTDLVNWNSGPGFTSNPIIVSDDGATQVLEVSAAVPVTAAETQYLRLRVTSP